MIRGSLTYPLNSILVVVSMERLRSGKQGEANEDRQDSQCRRVALLFPPARPLK